MTATYFKPTARLLTSDTTSNGTKIMNVVMSNKPLNQPVSTTATNPQSQYYKSNYCTQHTQPMWRIGHTVLVADKLTVLERRTDLDLLIDCSTDYPVASHRTGGRMVLPPEFQSLAQYERQPTARLQIPWPDFGLPAVSVQFWQELVKMLPAGKVGIGCVGGHGRTGTALACLRVAGLQESARVAVDTVRSEYCDQAIEASAQLWYIVDLAVACGTTPAGVLHQLDDARRREDEVAVATVPVNSTGTSPHRDKPVRDEWLIERDSFVDDWGYEPTERELLAGGYIPAHKMRGKDQRRQRKAARRNKMGLE